MAHADPFDLAEIAAGAPVSASLREHLDTCADCRAELTDLRRTITAPHREEIPRPELWGSIHTSLALPVEVAAAPFTAGDAPEPAGRGATRIVRPRRRWAIRISLAVATAVVVAVAGVFIGIRIAAPPRALQPTVVAGATLKPFPGWDAAGRAVVEVKPGGDRVLTVTLPGSAPNGDVREVWLMRYDLKALISVGLLEGRTGTFAIPDGIDLAQYNVVDVSAEPVDGNPAHSGDSIVRGTLSRL